jgi:hypothetical protein
MPIDVRIDVSRATPFAEPQHIAASVFLPEKRARETPLIVCLPGGGYTRGYYDAHFPGLSGYSMAEWFTARGCVVCTLDHLGVGGSSRPRDEPALTVPVIAGANHAAALHVADMITRGTLPGGAPPIAIGRRIGVGHSMGAMLIIAQQALHSTFDLLAPLGWTNEALELGEHFEPPAIPADATWGSRYVVVERGALQRRLFYWDDVPESLIAHDEQQATVIPVTLLGEIMRPGTVAAYAGQIKSPVFLAFGERDNCREPRREPASYTSCDDMTLHLLPRAGHCHNFASTREQLWRRLMMWISDRLA